MMMKCLLFSLFFALASRCSAFVVGNHGRHWTTTATSSQHRDDPSFTTLQAHNSIHDPLWKSVRAVTASLLVASSILFHHPLPAFAGDPPRIVGALQGSGLVFKDTLEIQSFDDPKVKGVTLYVSNFQRPITERLTSNFLADPTYASVACAKTGAVAIADNIVKGKTGEQVFDEKRSLFFKDLRVQRIYDEEKKTVVYVSYTTRLDKNDDTNKSRFKSSLCAVNLDDSSSMAAFQMAAEAANVAAISASMAP